ACLRANESLASRPHSVSALLDCPCCVLFFFNDPAPTEFYPLSLHDALPISSQWGGVCACVPRPASRLRRVRQPPVGRPFAGLQRSEEHTSELQSLTNLVCRLLLEKKKKTNQKGVLVGHKLTTPPPIGTAYDP